MKKCSKCRQSKPYDEFHLSSNSPTGRTGYCKSCVKAYGKRRYKRKTPTNGLCRVCGVQPKDRKRAICKSCVYKERISSQYGLTIEQYNLILVSQGNVCAICNATGPLCIDHDHSCCPGIHTCGKCIRGLLCRNCNTGLGLLKDDPQRLSKAIDYLRHSKTHQYLD